MKAFIIVFLTCCLASPVPAQSSGKKRDKWVDALQQLRAGDSGALFELDTNRMVAAIRDGDEGIAYLAVRGGDHMLDNEAWFAVLANAILFFPDRTVEALRLGDPAATRSILEVCADGGELAFPDEPDLAKRFKKVVQELAKKTKKMLPLPGPGDGYAAVINDPDGYTNLRLGPGADSPVIDKIRKGEELLVVSKEGDWWHVYSPRGDYGFMHKSRIRLLR